MGDEDSERRRRGQHNGGTAPELDPDGSQQVDEIKALLGTMMQKDIAAKFGVSKPTITLIKQGKIWKDQCPTTDKDDRFVDIDRDETSAKPASWSRCR